MLDRLKKWFITSLSTDRAIRLDLARLLGACLAASAFVSMVSILFAFITRTAQWERLLRDALIVLIISIVLWGMLRRGYERLVAYGAIAGFAAFAAFSAFTGIGVRGTSYGLFLLVIVTAALFIHRRFAYLMALLGSLVGLGLMYANRAGLMPNVDRPLAEAASWLIQTAYFFIAAVLLDVAMRQIDRAMGQAQHELEERKRAEEKILELNVALEQKINERTAQLAESEERYRLIASSSSDYVFSTEVDEQGNVNHNWVAGAFETIMGYPFEEYQARGGWLSVLHPDDREQDAKDMENLRQNQAMTTEVRIIKKSGEIRWIRVYGNPVWDKTKNRLVGIYGAVQDITTQKQAEEALREAELRYRTLVEQTSVVIYRDTPDKKAATLYISPQIETLLGYSVEEWLNTPVHWQALIHPEDRQHVEQVMVQIETRAPGQKNFRDEYRLQARDGRWVWVRDEAVIVMDAHETPLFVQGVLIDITEQKEAEARAREMTQGLWNVV